MALVVSLATVGRSQLRDSIRITDPGPLKITSWFADAVRLLPSIDAPAGRKNDDIDLDIKWQGDEANYVIGDDVAFATTVRFKAPYSVLLGVQVDTSSFEISPDAKHTILVDGEGTKSYPFLLTLNDKIPGRKLALVTARLYLPKLDPEALKKALRRDPKDFSAHMRADGDHNLSASQKVIEVTISKERVFGLDDAELKAAQVIAGIIGVPSLVAAVVSLFRRKSSKDTPKAQPVSDD